jgi:hypothetical protein
MFGNPYWEKNRIKSGPKEWSPGYCYAKAVEKGEAPMIKNTNEIKPFDRNDLNQPSLYYVIAFWDTNAPIHSVGRLEIRTDVGPPPPEGYALQGYMNTMPFTFSGIGTLEGENELDRHSMTWKTGGFAIHNMDTYNFKIYDVTNLKCPTKGGRKTHKRRRSTASRAARFLRSPLRLARLTSATRRVKPAK